MKLVCLLLLLVDNLYASGTLRFVRPSKPKPKIDRSLLPVGYRGYQKNARELESHVFSLKRNKDISIHKVVYKGKSYRVEGVYREKDSLKKFKYELEKPGHLEKKVKVKTYTTKFAGRKTKHYILSGDNIW